MCSIPQGGSYFWSHLASVLNANLLKRIFQAFSRIKLVKQAKQSYKTSLAHYCVLRTVISGQSMDFQDRSTFLQCLQCKEELEGDTNTFSLWSVVANQDIWTCFQRLNGLHSSSFEPKQSASVTCSAALLDACLQKARPSQKEKNKNKTYLCTSDEQAALNCHEVHLCTRFIFFYFILMAAKDMKQQLIPGLFN